MKKMKRLSIIASLAMLGTNLYSQNISFKKGWSLNAALEDITISEVFSKSCIETVWSYNSSVWKAYSPYASKQNIILKNNIDELKSLKKGEGYWINVISDNCSINLKDEVVVVPEDTTTQEVVQEDTTEEEALKNPKFKYDENTTFDINGCETNGYNIKSHIASFSPEIQTKDIKNGISIKSTLSPNSFSAKYFEVNLYYKSNTQNLLNTTSTFSRNGIFELTYDSSWVSLSDNVVYLKYYSSSNDKLPTCERVKLDNKNGSNLISEKVFR